MPDKQTRDLLKQYHQASDQPNNIYGQALRIIEGMDDRICELEIEVGNLEDELIDAGSDEGLNTDQYSRKDIEDAIAAGDKDHLRVVLDTIFGAE